MTLRPDAPQHSQNAIAQPAPAGHARDPVCGMSVDSSAARYRVELGSTTIAFCSEHCQGEFLSDPDRYLK
ncbi:MAG: YHS domain-containing protein, partial [Steroidobacteraceae bacterium]